MTAVIDSRSRELLSEAAEWRLLSLLFECPSPGWRTQIAGLTAEVADPKLQECARLALEQASEGLYHSTFGPGGPAAPREVSYSDTLQFGYLMSELQACYDAFGYQPQTREAPDHVAVETGFIAFLKMKEAFAHASARGEQAALTNEAAEQFVTDHLSRIAHLLAERLSQSGLEYLAGAACLVSDRLGEIRKAETQPASELRVLQEEGDFSCGATDSVGPIDESGSPSIQIQR